MNSGQDIAFIGKRPSVVTTDTPRVRLDVPDTPGGRNIERLARCPALRPRTSATALLPCPISLYLPFLSPLSFITYHPFHFEYEAPALHPVCSSFLEAL